MGGITARTLLRDILIDELNNPKQKYLKKYGKNVGYNRLRHEKLPLRMHKPAESDFLRKGGSSTT